MNDRPNTHGTARAPASQHLRLGNFGMLLPLQNPPIPTWAEDFGIDKLEEAKRRGKAERIAAILGGSGGIMHDAEDASRNSEIPAAYTFFAQFVDHDITLDAESELTSEALTRGQVEGLPNLRSASLDLDSVYGFGPDVSPHLYDGEQQRRLLVGSKVGDVENPNDVPRSADGTALIGDPRNDENIFLSQMHLLFLRFHNRRIIDLLIRHDNANEPPPRFEDVQRDVRYHYQALVLYDFLRRVCDKNVYNFALEKIQKNANRSEGEKDYPFFLGHLIDDAGRLRMPVEFSAAAYRFGHTLVRSNYPANSTYPRIEIFDERFRTTGLSPIPPELTVDWRFLLDVDPTNQDYVRSKAIDHLLANELANLPRPVAGRDARDQDRSLAFRNLLRGYVLGLPSGQQVAAALPEEYGINPAQDLAFNNIPRWQTVDETSRNKLEKHTPLFFYLMREARVQGNGNRLGPVGSAILMEVFGAMLLHGAPSFLTDKKKWDADSSLVDENVAENRDEPDNANGSPANNEDGDEPESRVSRPNRERVTLASLVRYVNRR